MQHFLTMWDRIVLLRDDLRRDASFVRFCLKAGLNHLVVPALEQEKRLSIFYAFALSCNGTRTETIRQIITHQMKVVSGKRNSSLETQWNNLLSSFLTAERDSIKETFLSPSELFNIWRRHCNELQREGQISDDEILAVIENGEPSPLHVVCDAGNFPIIEELLHLGAKPRDLLPWRGLMVGLCAKKGIWSEHDLEVLSMLLNRAAEANGLGPELERGTFLHKLCKTTKPDSRPVRMLLQIGASSGLKDRLQRTPLHRICSSELPWKVVISNDKQICPDASDVGTWEESCPHMSHIHQIIVELLEQGADPNS